MSKPIKKKTAVSDPRDKRITLAIPHEIHPDLREEADKEMRSLTAQIQYILKMRYKK